ncbi:MAG: sigma-70 family RNA polymerase sigma factor [bacterium]|nr:sigma-70 family RNA polymerase sigma factor [bacterium]
MKDRDKFIEQNIPLVHSLCKRFKGKGTEYDDLFQVGCVGLIKAVDGFDEERGLCFSTYAVPVILGEIKKIFRDGGSVKIARSLKERSLKVLREKEIIEKQIGHEATVNEIAQRLNLSSEEVTEALCASQSTVSLTVDSEDGLEELSLPVESTEDCVFDKILLNDLLKRLKPGDRNLIVSRYFKEKTQQETAANLGMTQVQVSRREKAILLQMREMLA